MWAVEPQPKTSLDASLKEAGSDEPTDILLSGLDIVVGLRQQFAG